MKKWIALILTFVMALSLAACGGDTAPAENPAEAKQEEPEPSPQEIAEDIDGTVNVFVQLATNSMNELANYIGGLGSTYTADNLLEYAEPHISDGYDWCDAVEELSIENGGGDYFLAADDCVKTSLASWLFLREYLEEGKSEDLNNLATNVGIYPSLSEAYTAARKTYLESAGFSADEASTIIGIAEQPE